MSTTTEKDIERKLRLLVENYDGQCLKWVCPGWSGVPDRIVLLPRGRICFVETKRPKGGRLSALQQWWANRLSALGFAYWVVWNEEDLRVFEQDELNWTAREDPDWDDWREDRWEGLEE